MSKTGKMKCGCCGQEKHTLILLLDGNLLVECTECNNKSIITIGGNPKIVINNYEGLGCICVY